MNFIRTKGKYVKVLAILLALMLMFGCSATGGETTGTTGGETAAGTSQESDTAVKESENQNISIGFTSDTSFKTPYTDYGYAGCLKSLVFESLITLDAEWGFQPLLAQSWEQESDTSFLFNLRSGVTFSDGTPVTANDVKSSISYITDTLESTYLSTIKDVEVVDADTVRITLKAPSMNFFNELSGYGHISKILATDDKGVITRALGTGPFVLGEYKEGQSFTLEKNPDYWQGEVKLQTVTFKYISEPASVSAALDAGQIDMASSFATATIPNTDVSRFSANDRFRVYQSYIRMVFVGLNLNKAPFDDEKVRRAVCMAVDKDAINQILSGSGVISTAPVAASAKLWTNEQIKGIGRDMDGAKELLEQAGWKDESGDGIREKAGTPLKVSLLLPPNDADRKAMAESVQYQLKQIGIDVSINEMEWSAISEKLKANDWDMVGPANDSSSGRVPPRWKFSAYPLHSAYLLEKNADFKAMVEGYEKLVKQEEQIPVAKQIQQVLADTNAFPFWYEFYRTTVSTSKLANFTPSPGEQHDFRLLWQAYVSE